MRIRISPADAPGPTAEKQRIFKFAIIKLVNAIVFVRPNLQAANGPRAGTEVGVPDFARPQAFFSVRGALAGLSKSVLGVRGDVRGPARVGATMTRLYAVALATIGLAAHAHAADLPAKTAEQTTRPAADCFSSLWTYLNSSISDCPLTYAGITLYGNLDGGYGYETHGVPGNPSADKVNYAHPEEQQQHPLAVVAQRAQHLRHRSQNGRESWLRLVVDRRRGSRIQPLFGHADQWSAVAGRQQYQRGRESDSELQFEPRWPVGQLAGLCRRQQSRLWQAHFRPHKLARSRTRYPRTIRSHRPLSRR